MDRSFWTTNGLNTLSQVTEKGRQYITVILIPLQNGAAMKTTMVRFAGISQKG